MLIKGRHQGQALCLPKTPRWLIPPAAVRTTRARPTDMTINAKESLRIKRVLNQL